MHRAVEILTGAWELIKMGFATRFRFRGPYWQWRLHTAFGRGVPPRRDLVRSVLRYGAWVRQMRRLM